MSVDRILIMVENDLDLGVFCGHGDKGSRRVYAVDHNFRAVHSNASKILNATILARNSLFINSKSAEYFYIFRGDFI